MKSTTVPENKTSTRKSVRSKSKEKAPANTPTSQRPPDPRVGTRSVNTLSDAQLERKRANDREAQRIIRQRTREHIENLERQVAELGEQKEQLNKALQHNAELEAQIAQLQQQVADMALLLQYRQSPGVPGYTDTTTVYTARSCVPLSSLARSVTSADRMQATMHCPSRESFLGRYRTVMW
jgi:myosin heavy subunit